MIMTPAECRQKVIVPALNAIGLWSPAAEDVMLGTALQESGLRTTHQVGGPALGLWDMEPATHDDIWRNFLAFRAELSAKVKRLAVSAVALVQQLEQNHPYACAMARLKYYRSPAPLPAHGDIDGYAHLWKTVYNTAGGKGTEAEFIANWNALAAHRAERPSP
jgi:hypothetical protein